MAPSPLKKLIGTHAASELFGYTPDYLARLAREGKVSAERIGRNWVIDRASLAAFVEQQGIHTEAYARALAREREEEYRASRAKFANTRE